MLKRKKQTLNILGATSGDTGSAAEYAMRGKKSINVFMLSPHGRMSAFQRAQMYSLQDANIHNLAVQGVFDDCQDVVKKVNADAAFKAKYRIGAVNSINWARVAAQVVYYFKGYFAATKENNRGGFLRGALGQFRQHLRRLRGALHGPAGAQADPRHQRERRAGRVLPHRQVPRAQDSAVATSSPSMDISKASNFERYVFDLLERDGAKVKRYFASAEGFDLSLIPRPGFVSGKSTHADRLATIRDIHAKYGVIIDPHTADGVKVGLAHREAGVPLVCLETALPAKFARDHPRGARARTRPAGRASRSWKSCRSASRSSRRTPKRSSATSPRMPPEGGLTCVNAAGGSPFST